MTNIVRLVVVLGIALLGSACASKSDNCAALPQVKELRTAVLSGDTDRLKDALGPIVSYAWVSGNEGDGYGTMLHDRAVGLQNILENMEEPATSLEDAELLIRSKRDELEGLDGSTARFIDHCE